MKRKSKLKEYGKKLPKVWETEKIPEDWKTAMISPIHKKGDRKDCYNYRGIAL